MNSPEKKAATENWRKAHPDQVRGYKRKWAKAHPDRIQAMAKRLRETHPERWTEYRRKFRAKRRAELQTFVDAIKGAPCLDCHQSFPPPVMEFDHVRGVKIAEVARLVATCRTLEVIRLEIAKCDLVCANCHRLRTTNRRLALRY